MRLLEFNLYKKQIFDNSFTEPVTVSICFSFYHMTHKNPANLKEVISPLLHVISAVAAINDSH